MHAFCPPLPVCPFRIKLRVKLTTHSPYLVCALCFRKGKTMAASPAALTILTPEERKEWSEAFCSLPTSFDQAYVDATLAANDPLRTLALFETVTNYNRSSSLDARELGEIVVRHGELTGQDVTQQALVDAYGHSREAFVAIFGKTFGQPRENPFPDSATGNAFPEKWLAPLIDDGFQTHEPTFHRLVAAIMEVPFSEFKVASIKQMLDPECELTDVNCVYGRLEDLKGMLSLHWVRRILHRLVIRKSAVMLTVHMPLRDELTALHYTSLCISPEEDQISTTILMTHGQLSSSERLTMAMF